MKEGMMNFEDPVTRFFGYVQLKFWLETFPCLSCLRAGSSWSHVEGSAIRVTCPVWSSWLFFLPVCSQDSGGLPLSCLIHVPVKGGQSLSSSSPVNRDAEPLSPSADSTLFVWRPEMTDFGSLSFLCSLLERIRDTSIPPNSEPPALW